MPLNRPSGDKGYTTRRTRKVSALPRFLSLSLFVQDTEDHDDDDDDANDNDNEEREEEAV